MRIERHPSKLTLAEAEAQTALVDLLLAHVERAYVTAGGPGMLTAVRELFSRMDPAELRALAYQADLIPEPAAEGDDGLPRSGREQDEG